MNYDSKQLARTLNIWHNANMLLEIKVITKAHENAIVGFENGILKIRCTAVPEKGRANDIVISLIAKHFNVPKRAVKILSGKTASRKRIEILKQESD